MRYLGGKQRISKELSCFLNSQLKENQSFVDLFCGSCNIVSKIDNNRLRIANDKHKYLIEMWKALQNGWEMPDIVTEEDYKYIKEHKDENPPLAGFVGFGCSYAGRWFEGYARSGERNFCLNAKNSNLKILQKIQDVVFYNEDYKDVDIPIGSLVYCDIPYKDSKPYSKKEVGIFNYNEFYQWVRDNSDKYDIYISEYKHNVPENFEIVWEKKSKKDLRNKNNEQESTIEILMRYKNK